jgi:hypothetical protein
MEMPKLYWVNSYYIAPNKQSEYQKWLSSPEAKDLFSRFEKETGIRYLNTYWTSLGLGEFDCEDWFELTNWAAMDKVRDSKAMEEYAKATWNLTDQTRPGKVRVVRSTEDIRVFVPSK